MLRTSNWLQPALNRMTLLIFVIVLFIVGVVFGIFVYQALTLDQQERLAGELTQYADTFGAGFYPDAGETLRDRAGFHAKWMLLIWLLGVTVVGMPLVLALDFAKGVLIGFSLGALIQEYGWHGLLFALVTIAPPNIIIIPAIVMASASAVAFSLYVIKHRLLQPGGELGQPLLAHTGASLFMLLAVWGAALFEAYVSPHLIGWAAPYLTG